MSDKNETSSSINDFLSEAIISYFNNIFWEWQYSARHYILKYHDFDISPITSILEKIFDRKKKNILIKDLLWATIIVYHNLEHKNCEDLFKDPRIPPKESDNIGKKLKKLNPNEYNFIGKIHKITYEYGFFISDLLLPLNMLQILVKYNLKKDEDIVLFPPVETFLKKDDDSNFGIEVNCIRGSDEELPKSKPDKALTIFIDPLDESDTISGIKEKLKQAIENKKFPVSIGCKEKAKMAFYLDSDHTSYSNHKIMEVIRLNVEKYRNFDAESHNNSINFEVPINPELIIEIIEKIDEELSNPNLSKTEIKQLKGHRKEMRQELRHQKKISDKIKMTTGTNHKQRSPASRAIGLYLWDCVNFSGLIQPEAINRFINLYKNEKYKNYLPSNYDENRVYIEDAKRLLRRELALADDCIDQCSVLNLNHKKKR